VRAFLILDQTNSKLHTISLFLPPIEKNPYNPGVQSEAAEMTMAILSDYDHFDGRHYETGSIQNVLAYQGVKAPHTGRPYSEALLMGISGGATFGYFNFHYEGYLPILPLLSRNTFDPFETLLTRLGIRQDLRRTTTPDKGLTNLHDTLESGRPAIIWADVATLPYNGYHKDQAVWGMLPLVVYGLDDENAYLADRSGQPLIVRAKTLAEARARIKKEKFAVLSLDPPQPDKIPSAVTQGIWDTIRLFSEKPPRGTARNFGFRGYDHWADMLTNTRNKFSWARYYPAGPEMFAALAGYAAFPGLYGAVQAWGDGGFERARYADFLDEAAAILSKATLKEAAQLFRNSHRAWKDLTLIAMPEDVPQLKLARHLHDQRATFFIDHGSAAQESIQAIAIEQAALLAAVKNKFDLDETGAASLREQMAEQVLKIKGIEEQTVQIMKDAMA
jgi:hypothetical protein